MDAAEVWKHQLRWARTIRVCEPGSYFFSVLGNASLWPLVWLAAAPSGWSAAGCGACLVFRMAAGFYLECRLNGRRSIHSWWLALVKDFLQVAIWALAFTGRQVSWRGEQYRVESGGKLVKLAKWMPAALAPARVSLQTKPE
jgi:ceramide glucosyltransferase